MRRFAPVLILVLALVAASCGEVDSAAVDAVVDDSAASGGGAARDVTPTLPLGPSSTAAPATTAAPGSPVSSTSTTSTSVPSTTIAPTTTAGEVPADVYALSELATSQPPTSFRMSMTAEMSGFEEFEDEVAGFSVRAAFTADGRSGELEMDMSSLLSIDPGEADAEALQFFGDVIAMKWIGDTSYVSSGLFSWFAPVDTPWIGLVDDGSGSSTGMSTDTFSPDEFLAVLRSLDPDAENLGWEVMDGVNVVHVSGTVSAASLAASGNDSFLEGMDPTGGGLLTADIFDIDVWVGDDGIVRRMEFGVDDLAALDPTAVPGSSFRFVIEMTDIGADVVIEAPPAADVTWIDDIASSLFGEFD